MKKAYCALLIVAIIGLLLTAILPDPYYKISALVSVSMTALAFLLWTVALKGKY